MEAVKPKSHAGFLFFVNNIQAIINKGFVNQVIAAPPVNIASQPISKASIEVLQPLSVQKQILKSEKIKSPIPTINTTVFNFDFTSTNICSSSENGIMKLSLFSIGRRMSKKLPTTLGLGVVGGFEKRPPGTEAQLKN